MSWHFIQFKPGEFHNHSVLATKKSTGHKITLNLKLSWEMRVMRHMSNLMNPIFSKDYVLATILTMMRRSTNENDQYLVAEQVTTLLQMAILWQCFGISLWIWQQPLIAQASLNLMTTPLTRNSVHYSCPRFWYPVYWMCIEYKDCVYNSWEINVWSLSLTFKCCKMLLEDGEETNANSEIKELQMLQDAARRRRWRNATSWLQVPNTTVRAC